MLMVLTKPLVRLLMNNSIVATALNFSKYPHLTAPTETIHHLIPVCSVGHSFQQLLWAGCHLKGMSLRFTNLIALSFSHKFTDNLTRFQPNSSSVVSCARLSYPKRILRSRHKQSTNCFRHSTIVRASFL